MQRCVDVREQRSEAGARRDNGQDASQRSTPASAARTARSLSQGCQQVVYYINTIYPRGHVAVDLNVNLVSSRSRNETQTCVITHVPTLPLSRPFECAAYRIAAMPTQKRTRRSLCAMGLLGCRMCLSA